MKTQVNNTNDKKSILFIVNNIDFFLSHRKKIGLEALKEGFKFIVCAPRNKNTETLKSLGFNYHQLPLRRGSLNIFKELYCLYKLNLLVKEIDPDLIHLVTIKPIIYGGLIAKIRGNLPILVAFPGLGHLYTTKKISSMLITSFVNQIFKLIFSNPNYKVIFQNKADANQIIKNANLESKQCFYTYGSGVDLKEFSFSPIKEFSKIKFLFASRLLKDKGIHDFYGAAKLLKDSEENNFEFLVAGDIDKENPSSISEKELEEWITSGIIKYIPFTKDIKQLLSETHITVLPSYREGMPKILLEASAIGRPIVTTRAPGCDECVVDNFNGFKVNPGDIKLLSKKMKELGINKENIKIFGGNSRKLAEERYSENKVVKQHLVAYRSLINSNS